MMGVFGEFAHPVKNLDTSVGFWSMLGFSIDRYESPYPWAIASDGVSIVGLHQTDSFNYPVITYFAADQKDKIENLRKIGLKNITGRGDGSVVLLTPEDQHVNLFTIGM